MKNIVISLILLFSIMCNIGLADNIDTLNKNLLELSSFKYHGSDSQIVRLLTKICQDGKFNDINYVKKNSKEYAAQVGGHLERLQMMCNTYSSSKSKLFNDSKLKKQIYKVIDYWVKLNPVDYNWWHRAIGFPKKFAPCVLVMYADIKKDDPKLLQRCSKYLINEWNGKIDPNSNSIQIAQVALVGASVGQKYKLVKQIVKMASSSLIKIQTGLDPKRGNHPMEGPLPDMGYNAHNLRGAQLYWGTYGVMYMMTNAWFVKALEGTAFQVPTNKIDLIADLYLEGIAWIIYRNAIDINTLGRGLMRHDPAQRGKCFNSSLLTFIPHTSTTKQVALKKLYNNVADGKNTVTGNRAFWNFDFMVHRRDNYYISIRMTSNRTSCNESGLGEGNNNYYTGSGCTYIMENGNEYNRDLLKKWNWRRLPGITAAQENGLLPLVNWGSSNDSNYAGVVSNGEIGVAAFVFKRGKVNAHKAYFCFDGGMVCLGTDIKSSSNAVVETTVNQLLNSNSKLEVVSYETVVWGGATYISMGGSFNVEKYNGITWLGFKHGIKPQNGKYAYAVLPGVKTASLKKISFKVLANDKKCQAVRFDNGTVMAVFYTPGTLQNQDKKVLLEAKMPLLIIKKGSKLWGATPYGYETKTKDTIITAFDKNGKRKEYKIAFSSAILEKGRTVLAQK